MSIGDLWLHGVVSPLTTALAYLIALTGNAALGIIVFTILTRVVLLPLSVVQVRSQKRMLALQPELQAIAKRYGKDPERRMQEQMRLYREHGVNPALGCLPLLLQLPILFGLYAALSNMSYYYNPLHGGQYLTEFQRQVAPTLTERFLYLCSLAGPDGIPMHGGVPFSCPTDLSDPSGLLNPANFLTIAGIHVPGPMLLVMTVLSFVVQRMMVMPSSDPQQQQINRMMAFMPLMYLFFFSAVPAGLVLYWLVTNVVSIVQQYLIAGPGSLRLRPQPQAEAAPAGTLVEPSPEPDGAAGASPAERRPAARPAKRRKSGRR